MIRVKHVSAVAAIPESDTQSGTRGYFSNGVAPTALTPELMNTVTECLYRAGIDEVDNIADADLYNEDSFNRLAVAIRNATSSKSAIINGAMEISQRSAAGSFPAVTDGQYLVDRWIVDKVTSTVVNADRVLWNQAGVGNTKITKALRLQSQSGYGAATKLCLTQNVEGIYLRNLGNGQRKTTLSLQILASFTGQISVAIQSPSKSFSFVKQLNVVANVAEQHDIVVPPFPAGGSFSYESGALGAIVSIVAGCGATYQTPITNDGQWIAGDFLGFSTNESITNIALGSITVTGVQWRKGSVGGDFIAEDPSKVWLDCMRYYQIIDVHFAGDVRLAGMPILSDFVPFMVPMRITPTVAGTVGTVTSQNIGTITHTATPFGWRGQSTGTAITTSVALVNAAGVARYAAKLAMDAEL